MGRLIQRRCLQIGLARSRHPIGLLLGPAPLFGFVALEFASDRGQQALPQVLRNDQPLNPDRRPGWDSRSGNTAGKRRSAAVICHAATPGARARANACVDSATQIARSIQPKSQFVMSKLPKVPGAWGLGAANPMRSTVSPLARSTVCTRWGGYGARGERRMATIDRTNAGVTARPPAGCPGDACVRSAKRSGMSASAPGAKPLKATT